MTKIKVKFHGEPNLDLIKKSCEKYVLEHYDCIKRNQKLYTQVGQLSNVDIGGYK